MHKSTLYTFARALIVLTLVLGTIPVALNAQPAQVAEAAATTAQLGGGIVINEVLPDPNGTNNFDTDLNGTYDTDDEFVEIYNQSGSAIDISGYQIWDAGYGLWFTFPPATTLGAGNYAYVINDVQTGGSLRTLAAGNLAFDAGIGTTGIVNNGGDNVVLYNPGADEYIQIRYNGDAADDPTATYAGFSGTATRVGSVEDWGNDSDGRSLVRSPGGDTNVVQHHTVSANNASPGEGLAAGDTAPTVTSTSPANGAINVPINSNIGVTFSEPVNFIGFAFDITCTASGAHTYTSSYNPATNTETLDPDVDFNVGETCTVTVYAANVTDADTDDPPDNMAADYVFAFTTAAPACGSPATLISAIQGSGLASPEDGNVHTIEGVVVGDFQTSSNLRGFFLQEEDTDADGDPTTSEGIFVYDGSSPAVDVSVGDVVRVTGTVDEYWDLTELTNVTNVEICPPGGTASAATVTLPVTTVDDWEWYEGMLINIPQTLHVTGNYSQGRYGEVDLSFNDRLDTPTNVVAPGAAAIALQDANDLNRIQLEDGMTTQNPVPVPYIGTGNTLRAGDTLPSLTGVLHYAYDYYEVHPTGPVAFTRANTRDAAPPAVGGTLSVASFNVLNYFSTLDDSGAICGPTGGMDCRGADDAAEFTRQRDKIIDAIVTMDAGVVGLMELENHPTDAALQDLVNGLNAVAGAGTYAYIDTGTIGTDAIKVAFIYQPAAVTPSGLHAILDSSVDPTFLDTYNRPVLAQTFTDNATGAVFTVAVNHLKSKGSDCDALGDPDTGDGQGNCNLTRTDAATALVNWLATDPTSSGDTDFLIIGDLNSYAMEDPITAITTGGYTNLISTFMGPDDAYSYVYYGQAGYLDHALANGTLAAQVTGTAAWHINADEPAALDYNDYNQPAGLYNPDPYRASDHDPVMIGLALDTPLVPPADDPAAGDAGAGGTGTGDAGSPDDPTTLPSTGYAPQAEDDSASIPAWTWVIAAVAVIGLALGGWTLRRKSR